MSNRILTTHVGSLPRSAAVTELLFAAERGEPTDPVNFDMVMREAVAHVVARQRAAGIDIVSDGEQSKISYATYIKNRLTGFEGDSPRSPPADLEDFPSFLDRQARSGGTPTYRRPCCVGPVTARTLQPLHEDLDRFANALAVAGQPTSFMNAASPGVIALFQPDRHYGSGDAYLEALAEAMRPEYEGIVAAGHLLQIDSPDLGLGRHMTFKDRSEAEYLTCIERHVEMLNHALRGVPPERVRLHVCWGNYEGPHHRDIEMSSILPVLVKIKATALLFEAANPRHQHDWEAFAAIGTRLPDDMVLVPGVIDSTTNFIEHPRVVANRIVQFANIVGAERVIAGTDCGFSTFAGFGAVDPEIVWAKLKALSDGAALASERL